MRTDRSLFVAALLLLFACAEDTVVLSPVIVTPPSESTAYPYDGLDTLVLSIGRAGDDLVLQEAAVPIGDELVLPEASFGRELVIHLSGLAAGVEVSYGRTCAIDVLRDDVVPAPDLYFSRIVRWGPGGTPVVGHRFRGLAYGAPDGSALFLGGDDGASTERFDPVSGVYERLDIALTPRRRAALAVMAGGRALVIGGEYTSGELAEEIEILDPNPALPLGLQLQRVTGPGLVEHAAATLVDGTVLVTGGYLQGGFAGGQPTATASGWILGFGDGDVLDPPELLASPMLAPRAGHTITRLGGELGADALIVGGRDGDGEPVAACELYRPLREAFEPLPGARLSHPRWHHRAVRMPGGFVLILGGVTVDAKGEEQPVYELELYDPGQGRMTDAGLLPEQVGVTEQTMTALPDGRVLITGGRDAFGIPVSSAFIARLDPIDGQVDIVRTDSLAAARAGHSAVLLCDGTVLVVGGTDGAATQHAERYNPPSANRR